MGKSSGETGRGAVLDDVRRDACLHRLGDHYAEGRLSADELDARIQSALAAETEEDLASVMTDLTDEQTVEEAPQGEAPERASRLGPRVVRGAAALGILATGGIVVAVVGQGSNALEFAAGLAVGLLGFLAQWFFTTGPEREPGTLGEPAVSPAAPDLSDDRRAAADSMSVPVTSQSPSATGPVPRRVRDNGGMIPPQRSSEGPSSL